MIVSYITNMKNRVRIHLLWLFLFLPAMLLAQKPVDGILSPNESKARLKNLGDSLRKCDGFQPYDGCGWIVVNKNVEGSSKTCFGIMDYEGRMVLPCEYQCIRFMKQNNLILVQKDSLIGFMNRQFQWVIPPLYHEQYSCSMDIDDIFQNGMVVVTDRDDRYQGVVDTLGREILPCRYRELVIHSDNLFMANAYGGPVGAVNRKGDTLLPFAYQSLWFCGCENRIVAKRDGKYGLFRTDGTEILPCQYDDFNLFCAEKASWCFNGKWGIVDTLGHLVRPFSVAVPFDIVNGGFVLTNQDYKYGLMDLSGKMLVPCKYYHYLVSPSKDCIAMMTVGWNTDEIGYCDLYDRQGHLRKHYDSMDYFEDRVEYMKMFPVSENGKWGFLNTSFQQIIPCQYAAAKCFGDYGMVLLDDGQTGLLNEQGELLVKGPYDYFSPSANGWYYVRYMDNGEEYAGFVDQYGNTTFTRKELSVAKKNQRLTKKEWFNDNNE